MPGSDSSEYNPITRQGDTDEPSVHRHGMRIGGVLRYTSGRYSRIYTDEPSAFPGSWDSVRIEDSISRSPTQPYRTRGGGAPRNTPPCAPTPAYDRAYFRIRDRSAACIAEGDGGIRLGRAHKGAISSSQSWSNSRDGIGGSIALSPFRMLNGGERSWGKGRELDSIRK